MFSKHDRLKNPEADLVSYIQARPTRLMVRVGLELTSSGFQVWQRNHSATLSPKRLISTDPLHNLNTWLSSCFQTEDFSHECEAKDTCLTWYFFHI